MSDQGAKPQTQTTLTADDPGVRLIMLPGLGTDARFLKPQQDGHLPLDIPDLPPPQLDETVAQYAQRVAAAVRVPRGPFILAGVSFGGILALEMAPLLKPSAVVLVASCRSTGILASWTRRLGPKLRFVPGPLCKPLVGLMLWWYCRHERLSPRQQLLMTTMYRDSPSIFFRWAAVRLTNWQCSVALPCPVYHIHGGRDRLFGATCMDCPPDELVGDAGHAISMTHARIVNRFLAAKLSEIARQR
jgi:pimeloyl-ACP methyl ester carboxylesterase